MTNHRFPAACLALLLAVSPGLAGAADAQATDILPFKATTRTLPNGLVVIVVPTGFPNIVSLHAVTTANALRYAYSTSADPRTRLLLMLQGASFIPLFRGEPGELAAVVQAVAPNAQVEVLGQLQTLSVRATDEEHDQLITEQQQNV